MRHVDLIAAFGLILLQLGCSSPHVKGHVGFVLGGTTSGSHLIAPEEGSALHESGTGHVLQAGDEYIVSPVKAQVTFTGIAYKDANGSSLGSSDLTACTVTYDRTLSSGTVLLDCPFTVPTGAIAQIAVSFSKTLQLLVDDATVGIYTDPGSPSGFSTVRPAGGAAYVPYTVQIGTGSTRATNIIFVEPFKVTANSTPKLYITMDMIHTIQLKVDSGGTTLSSNGSSDPVAIFGGPTPGSSAYYSGASSADGYPVRGVPTLRIFNDASGNPLYAFIGPEFCGSDGGPKGALASPPAPGGVGGWLGKDANNVIAFALAQNGSYSPYNSYYVMPARTVVGQSTTLSCVATASPPPPADGKTYASGAPAMPTPQTISSLTLLTD